ncbi:hypothetical protein HAX54_017980, partial [Datura stramonium]|nr:hypothetical protein [Datura stramonium]
VTSHCTKSFLNIFKFSQERGENGAGGTLLQLSTVEILSLGSKLAFLTQRSSLRMYPILAKARS